MYSLSVIDGQRDNCASILPFWILHKALFLFAEQSEQANDIPEKRERGKDYGNRSKRFYGIDILFGRHTVRDACHCGNGVILRHSSCVDGAAVGHREDEISVFVDLDVRDTNAVLAVGSVLAICSVFTVNTVFSIFAVGTVAAVAVKMPMAWSCAGALE